MDKVHPRCRHYRVQFGCVVCAGNGCPVCFDSLTKISGPGFCWCGFCEGRKCGRCGKCKLGCWCPREENQDEEEDGFAGLQVGCLFAFLSPISVLMLLFVAGGIRSTMTQITIPIASAASVTGRRNADSASSVFSNASVPVRMRMSMKKVKSSVRCPYILMYVPFSLCSTFLSLSIDGALC